MKTGYFELADTKDNKLIFKLERNRLFVYNSVKRIWQELRNIRKEQVFVELL